VLPKVTDTNERTNEKRATWRAFLCSPRSRPPLILWLCFRRRLVPRRRVVNYVRQFPEQIIKLEKYTYASIARPSWEPIAQKDDRVAFGCSSHPPETGSCAHSRVSPRPRFGAMIGLSAPDVSWRDPSSSGVVRPSERDVQWLRVLGLMMLPACAGLLRCCLGWPHKV
jgi:hypothetical protein